MTNNASVDLQDFVPTEEWPDVSVMLEGFGRPSLPDSGDLAGSTIDITFENGWVIRHEFHSASSFTWTIIEGEGTGDSGTHDYRAVEVRPAIFYIDFLKGEGVKAHDMSIILNVEDGRVTLADTGFVDRNGEVRTHTDIISGRVVGAGNIEPRKRSDGLVGKRIYYRYSETEAYEHVYLNAGTVAWHCVKGGEKGLADVERTKTFELADDIYIFFWTETVMPVDSFLVIDLKNKRSIGRMFCWDGPALELVHLPFDSRFTVLNETVFPED